MPPRDDIVKKAFAQFDVMMGKKLEVVTKKFKDLAPPPPPKQKGSRPAPLVRTPFDG